MNAWDVHFPFDKLAKPKKWIIFNVKESEMAYNLIIPNEYMCIESILSMFIFFLSQYFDDFFLWNQKFGLILKIAVHHRNYGIFTDSTFLSHSTYVHRVTNGYLPKFSANQYVRLNVCMYLKRRDHDKIKRKPKLIFDVICTLTIAYMQTGKKGANIQLASVVHWIWRELMPVAKCAAHLASYRKWNKSTIVRPNVWERNRTKFNEKRWLHHRNDAQNAFKNKWVWTKNENELMVMYR